MLKLKNSNLLLTESLKETPVNYERSLVWDDNIID
jgi:hypothetical protein